MLIHGFPPCTGNLAGASFASTPNCNNTEERVDDVLPIDDDEKEDYMPKSSDNSVLPLLTRKGFTRFRSHVSGKG